MLVTNSLTTPKKFLINSPLGNGENIYYQLSPEELIEWTLSLGQGNLSDKGALIINTGEFTGRCPDDKFTVKDDTTENTINWNEFNIPIDEKYFDNMYVKMTEYLSNKKIWARDCFACADKRYRISIRVINEKPWSNLFAHNIFIRPTEEELDDFYPDWHIIQAPDFKADPATDGTRHQNFTMVSFAKKMILIGGSGYTGEIKKGIFSILNYLLPQDENILSMHCAANMGKDGNTAIFFGLSGTGKTTLSADPSRHLIGDDEHGWADNSIFNFEGGCYAKTINLSEQTEPEIYHAIRLGALIENVTCFKNTNTIDFCSIAITQNTRVSYPLDFIGNALQPSIGGIPKNIFFLTCDSYGILPPISKLDPAQAMYQFISGYTAKIAGTETGINEPKSTFSACFGAPFIPLHPGKYADMLGKKIIENKVNVWMINTGWTGGAYGTGNRIKLEYTRCMISAALEGKLDTMAYDVHPVFKIKMPKECTGVPTEILNPRNTWFDKNAYDINAKKLAQQFIKNFEKYASGVSAEILAAAPSI